MKRFLRWTGYVAGGVVALVVLAVLGVFGTSEWVLRRGHALQPERLQLASQAQLADAPRQAKILGCVSCHGENLGGREFLNVPNVVRIYAPNIPAIASRATDYQLARAIRQGVGHDGRSLFVMPSASYQRLSDGEVAAAISNKAMEAARSSGEPSLPATGGLPLTLGAVLLLVAGLLGHRALRVLR